MYIMSFGAEGYHYHNNRVEIPRHADISRPYLPTGDLAPDVQNALDNQLPWEDNTETINTFELSQEQIVRSIVVALNPGEEVTWGIYSSHRARNPDASPFVAIRNPADPRLSTNQSTLHIVGTTERPRLVRAYPGDYIAPLPWMSTAKSAEGGVDASIAFWQTHAYVHSPTVVKQEVPSAPAWHKDY